MQRKKINKEKSQGITSLRVAGRALHGSQGTEKKTINLVLRLFHVGYTLENMFI